MYVQYWNLETSPFLNVEDQKLMYPSGQLMEGIARLYYLIDQERIAGMLTGDYGVGKTFLLSCLVARTLEKKLPLVRVDAVPGGALPLARLLLESLRVPSSAATLPDALMDLQRFAMGGKDAATKRHILLVDEAHYLADGEGLYLLHFLCNLRLQSPQGPKPMFTLILSGAPELARAVRAYESLSRRIQLAWRLDPLTEDQTCEYVQHHMRVAGGDMWVFTLESLRAIHEFTGGVPRSINNLCDTALMLGFAAKSPHVTPEIVEQAALDTGLAADEGDEGGEDAADGDGLSAIVPPAIVTPGIVTPGIVPAAVVPPAIA